MTTAKLAWVAIGDGKDMCDRERHLHVVNAHTRSFTEAIVKVARGVQDGDEIVESLCKFIVAASQRRLVDIKLQVPRTDEGRCLTDVWKPFAAMVKTMIA